MIKTILCCLLMIVSGMAVSHEVNYEKIFEDIINDKVINCSGEPAWRITLPFDGDRWMAGRLAALAQSGFTRQVAPLEQAEWLLTPTGPTMAALGDSCCGRMLVFP